MTPIETRAALLELLNYVETREKLPDSLLNDSVRSQWMRWSDALDRTINTFVGTVPAVEGSDRRNLTALLGILREFVGPGYPRYPKVGASCWTHYFAALSRTLDTMIAGPDPLAVPMSKSEEHAEILRLRRVMDDLDAKRLSEINGQKLEIERLRSELADTKDTAAGFKFSLEQSEARAAITVSSPDDRAEMLRLRNAGEVDKELIQQQSRAITDLQGKRQRVRDELIERERQVSELTNRIKEQKADVLVKHGPHLGCGSRRRIVVEKLHGRYRSLEFPSDLATFLQIEIRDYDAGAKLEVAGVLDADGVVFMRSTI